MYSATSLIWTNMEFFGFDQSLLEQFQSLQTHQGNKSCAPRSTGCCEEFLRGISGKSCPGQCWASHPCKDLTTLWMGVSAVGWWHSMVLVFSKLNNLRILWWVIHVLDAVTPKPCQRRGELTLLTGIQLSIVGCLWVECEIPEERAGGAQPDTPWSYLVEFKQYKFLSHHPKS